MPVPVSQVGLCKLKFSLSLFEAENTFGRNAPVQKQGETRAAKRCCVHCLPEPARADGQRAEIRFNCPCGVHNSPPNLSGLCALCGVDGWVSKSFFSLKHIGKPLSNSSLC